MPSNESYRNNPSEYGGVPGRIAPPPHVPAASEVLGSVMKTDHDDAKSTTPYADRFKPAG